MTKRRSMRALILVLLALPLPCMARDGTNSSGGGDSYAQEFTGIAQAIARSLDRGDSTLSRTAERFATKVATMRVVTEDHVYFKNAEVDARNEPPASLVHLNRSRWREYSENSARKIALVSHEVYGLLGLIDQKYQKTGASFTPDELASRRSLVTVVLQSLDDHCSDAWCESDAEYSFENLECEKGKGCFLELKATTHPLDYGQDVKIDVLNKGVQSRITHENELLQITKVRCHFDRFQQPADMLTISAIKGNKGTFIDLSTQAFEDVDACIGQLEIKDLKLKAEP